MKRRIPQILAALTAMLFVVACWTQFEPPPPADDDDTGVVDDDDTSVDDDDDTSVVDDDDTTPAGCEEAATISCGEEFPANNNAPGSTNAVLSYSCTGLDFDGPEYAVRWDADLTGPVTVGISGIDPDQDLDLFVLSDPAVPNCDPEACIGSSNSTATEESVTFDATLGQTYFFVVDGYGGAVSNFVMEVDCTGGGDDDDDDTVPDDDDTAPDDDDTAPDDDDTTPDPCIAPANISATVTLTDPAGNPTTSLSVGSPITLNVSVQNDGGDSGTTSFTYGSACIFSWSLWYQNGNPVTGGPTCAPGVNTQNYACGAPPTSGSDSFEPIEGVSGNPVVPGTYDLLVDTLNFGTFTYELTVP